jgi:octaprenyl-diphosphate synthase
MPSELLGELATLQPQLRQVEQRFDEELASRLPCVGALVRHVSRFRGKMLRPTLVLLTGRACGRISDEHITIATVVEMVHMATLVHDDVLDEAELRRKGATINHLRGNEAAVLLGDYLISHSYHLCSSLDSQFAARVIGRTTNQVCEGELLQIDNRGNVDLSEATYHEIISRKTASLIAACCLLGAKFSGMDDASAAKLERYGRSLGIAFQIQDDVLDIVGDSGVVGKTLGIDVQKVKMTLPLIHFMRHAPAEHRNLLRSLLLTADPDKLEKIRNLILPSDSIAYARSRAADYVRDARSAVAEVLGVEARRPLELLAEYVIQRDA